MIEPDAAAPSSSVIRFVCMYDRLSVWFVGLFVSLSFFFSCCIFYACLVLARTRFPYLPFSSVVVSTVPFFGASPNPSSSHNYLLNPKIES